MGKFNHFVGQVKLVIPIHQRGGGSRIVTMICLYFKYRNNKTSFLYIVFKMCCETI